MTTPGNENIPGRAGEWFVPKFGPLKFRTFVGLLFLPYTGMVLAYTLIGACLAPQLQIDRIVALLVIYFLGLGIAAHALDALGSKRVKPWGSVFSVRQLWILAAVALVGAYGIALYYLIKGGPLLWGIAVLEGFFVFAYNLEWFHGRFHTDGWFAFSWGTLPLLAGFAMQTGTISLLAALLSMTMALFSLVEIRASRPYKELRRKRGLSPEEMAMMRSLESILKYLSLGVISLGVGLVLWRLNW